MAPRAFGSGFGAGFGGPHSHGTLVVKVGTVGPDPAWQDGDIVDAWSRHRVRLAHAQHLCHPALAARGAGGRMAVDALAKRMSDEVYQYRFERITATTVMRTDLFDPVAIPEVFGPEAIDVAQFLQRQLERGAEQIKIFGTEGAELWYGGRIRVAGADVNRVWAAIEQHSPSREIDHGDLTFDAEARHMLLVRVDDFDATEAQALVAPVTDVEDVMVRRRARRLPWRQLTGMSASRIAQVLDPQQALDLRSERKHPRALHVEAKS